MKEDRFSTFLYNTGQPDEECEKRLEIEGAVLCHGRPDLGSLVELVNEACGKALLFACGPEALLEVTRELSNERGWDYHA